MFPGPSDSAEDVTVLSTAPTAPDTHWHQTVVLLPDRCLKAGGGAGGGA